MTPAELIASICGRLIASFTVDDIERMNGNRKVTCSVCGEVGHISRRHRGVRAPTERERERKRYAERKAAGLCVGCGNRAEDGAAICRRCLDRLAARRKR